MNATEASVEFHGVSKSFGAKAVLRDLSLALPGGETTAIVGASGSGKTTLLQLVNGMQAADSGEVRVFGSMVPPPADTGALAALRRRIGYAVQGAGLFPHLTVADNVLLLPRLEGWDAPRCAERLDTLLDAMELPAEVARRYPHELSGGQQQRVGLARALVLQPRLLMLDEPFSAIDPITRGELYETFERVRSSSAVSTLLVTHDMREAVRLAQWLAVLKDGQVLQFASSSEVVASPADDYVARLVKDQLR